ncbi:MAG TPA: hypothetical protein VHE13_02145, partial [Opitutus sp.]|nr:hypothetical protein [Opitutus sp.]
IRDVRATMARHDRTEPMFVEHTGLHVVDVVRALGGEIVARELRRRRAGAGDWFEASLQFASGATGRVELRPMARALSESLHLAGDDFRVEIRSAEFDRGGWQAWSGDRLVVDHSLAPGTPKFVGNGTYAETEAFLHAVRSGGAFSPTPADVLPAMELCHALEHAPASSSAILL